MASDVMTLFNMPTQEQLGQQYLQGLMSSPAQLGAQSLLQQVVSLGGNAGAGLGYGVGRLMGGMTADEVRAKSIDDAMRTVQSMGLTSDADMYGALSQELAKRGLTQDALMARNAGLKAMQTEEQIRLDRQRGDIALSELGLRQTKAAQEAELFPLELEAKREAIAKIKEDRLQLEEQLAAALRSENKEKAAGIQRQLDAKAAEQRRLDEELKFRGMSAGAAVSQAETARIRAENDANKQGYNQVQYLDIAGNKVVIGYRNPKLKEGQFQAHDNQDVVFNSRQELEDYYRAFRNRQRESQQNQNKPVRSGTKPNPANYQ